MILKKRRGRGGPGESAFGGRGVRRRRGGRRAGADGRCSAPSSTSRTGETPKPSTKSTAADADHDGQPGVSRTGRASLRGFMNITITTYR